MISVCPTRQSLARAVLCLLLALVPGLARAQRPGADLPPPPGADLPPPPGPAPGDADVTPDGPPGNPDVGAPIPGGDPAQLPAPPSPATASEARTAMVIDAATRGIDPRVGQHVTHVMRQTLTALGYSVIDAAATVGAAQHARMTYPPAPADLWRVTLSAGVDRTAFARVWADGGRYIFELTVASADGTGPFFARGSSGAEDLYPVVEQLTRQAVPPPTVWDAAGAARYRGAATGAVAASAQPSAAQSPHTSQLAAPTPGLVLGPVTGAPFIRPLSPRETRDMDAPGRRFQLALYSVSAIGADGNGFYNHLIELSLGARLRRDIILSLQLGYANLNGREQREHNLLPMLVVEKRLRLSPGLDLSIPIKGAVGFLPFNGPVLRVSAGLAYALGERVEITADLLCPSFWLIDDSVFVSMNLSLGLIVRL
ncbi:MAG: hypothetical protein H6726_09950 [Sandaracinaceae bacterium]|nr:hypothetical protein [Sandaracinaceae bacterium]